MNMKGALGIITKTLMICALFIVIPMKVEAISLNPFGDNSLMIGVTSDEWVFTYTISLQEGFLDPAIPERSILYLTIGLGRPDNTGVPYTVDSYTVPPSPNLMIPPVTSNSFFLYFQPVALAPSLDDYVFTITYASNYDIYHYGQDMIIREFGGQSRQESFWASYADMAPDPSPVPEPATLFIVGSGMITLGLLSRKKRKI